MPRRRAYEIVRLDPGRVVLRRDVALAGSGRLRVEKTFTFGGDRLGPTLDLEVSVEQLAGAPIRVDLAIEWSLTMLGGGGNPAAYFRIGDERLAHDTTGERDEVTTIGSGNDAIGLDLATSAEPAAVAWWAPIETVSNSEYGFERTYQGSALTFVWHLELGPRARRIVTVRNVVAAAHDRSAEELAALDA